MASAEVPLDNLIYEGIPGAKLSLEVRDFGKGEKTLVIRFWLDGQVDTVMVSMEKFTSAFDNMRAHLMSGNWDDALSQLLAGKDN